MRDLTQMIKIAVLVSGSGSQLTSPDRCQSFRANCGVISNKPDAYALQRAQQAGIQTAVIEHKQYPSREAI